MRERRQGPKDAISGWALIRFAAAVTGTLQTGKANLLFILNVICQNKL